MKFLFQRLCIMIPVVIMALGPAGCIKRPTVGENVPSHVTTPAETNRIPVARVNGKELFLNELVKMMNKIDESRAGLAAVQRQDARKIALDQLVLRELALQEAGRQGVSANAREASLAMSDLVKSMGHEDGFADYLKKQNTTEAEVRAEIEKRLVLVAFFKKEVIDKVQVQDEDVRKEYERRAGDYRTPEKMRVIDAVVPFEQDEQTSLKKAGELLAAIGKSKDNNLLHLVPDESFMIRDRDLVKEKEPILYEAARKLNDNEFSGTIQAGDGVHILQRVNYTAPRQMSFEEVKGPLRKKMTAFAVKLRRVEWEQELRKDDKIEVLNISEMERSLRNNAAEQGNRK